MALPTEEFAVPKRTPGTIQEIPSPGITPKDSLIAKGWQHEQYIGISILLLGLVAIVGFFSRRFEYALLFAFVLSIILIVFFMTV